MKRTYSSILILLTSIIVFLFAYIMRTACTQIPVYGTSSTGLSAQHFDRNGAFAAADRQKEGSLMESDTENMPEKREQSETDDEHKQNKLPIVQSMQETSYYCVAPGTAASYRSCNRNGICGYGKSLKQLPVSRH